MAVIAPEDKTVDITSTVSKVAYGAAETLSFIQVINIEHSMILKISTKFLCISLNEI